MIDGRYFSVHPVFRGAGYLGFVESLLLRYLSALNESSFITGQVIIADGGHNRKGLRAPTD